MEFKEIKEIIKKYDYDENVKEALRWMETINYETESNKNSFLKMIKKYNEMLNITQQNKNIELNKTYYTTEWSYNPCCDGRFVYDETIRQHLVVNGIDCYFTNDNYRIYFKEDLYKTIEEARKQREWQNSFSYDYESYISRENIVKEFLTYNYYNNKVTWKVNKPTKEGKING